MSEENGLWRDPIGPDKSVRTKWIDTPQGSQRALFRRHDGRPVKDHRGRHVQGRTQTGLLYVIDHDGEVVVAGRKRTIDPRGNRVVRNMYTGETFSNGLRIMAPLVGPMANAPLVIASPKEVDESRGRG